MSVEQEIEIEHLEEENKRLNQWIDDLQSGMYINCVYCGHNYGPYDHTEGITCTMRNALQKHIKECPDHPMSKLKEKCIEAIRKL